MKRTTEESIAEDAERTIRTAVRWVTTAAIIVFVAYVTWALLWVIA